jgi:glyoxylase-like metal-dependent hydrolase (beta-lactamase superfamily II)
MNTRIRSHSPAPQAPQASPPPALQASPAPSLGRRSFLKTSALAATAFGLFARERLWAQALPLPPAPPPPARPAPAANGSGFVPLRRGAGVFNGRGGTIGWFVSEEALAVIDTQFPDTAAACLEGLPGREGRGLDVVINTHHHGDHTAGNPVFRPVAKTIVAHENVPALQRAAAARARPPAPDRQVYADTLFAETWSASLGAETVRARHHGPAHTGGDIIVVLENANVVHMGDLVFNRLYPVIDRPGGASIRGWISVLENAVKTYPSDAIYIFGHANPAFGVTGTRDDLAPMRDYLSALLAHVERRIAAGASREEICALENLPGFRDWHQPAPNRLQGNLGVAYDELTAAG